MSTYINDKTEDTSAWAAPTGKPGYDDETKVAYRNPIPGWMTLGVWSWALIFWAVGIMDWKGVIAAFFVGFFVPAVIFSVLKQRAVKRYARLHATP